MAYSPPYDLIVSSLYHILHKITVDFAKIPVKSSPFLSSSFFLQFVFFFSEIFRPFATLYLQERKPSVIEKENEDEITRQSALVCVWWSLDGSWLVAGWTAVVHHHRRHPRRDAVLQAGRTGIFPVYGGGAPSLLMNLLWLLFGGFALAISAALHGLLFCITIVGIPFGMQCFKFAKLALCPFGSSVAVPCAC